MYKLTTSCLMGIAVLLCCLYVIQSQPIMPVIHVVPDTGVSPALVRVCYLGIGFIFGSTLKKCPEDGTPKTCPASFTEQTVDGRTTCYKALQTSFTYDGAKEACRNEAIEGNGHIVTVNTESEGTAVAAFMVNNEIVTPIWIDAEDIDEDGSFLTHDGEIFDMTIGGGSGFCIKFNPILRSDCSEDYRVICESDPV